MIDDLSRSPLGFRDAPTHGAGLPDQRQPACDGMTPVARIVTMLEDPIPAMIKP